jgi:hypothetical protein
MEDDALMLDLLREPAGRVAGHLAEVRRLESWLGAPHELS